MKEHLLSPPKKNSAGPMPEALPPELAARLARFARRLRATETAIALLALLGGVLTVFLLLAILDRFVDTPMPVRLLLAMGGAVALAMPLAWWAHHWLLRRRDARELARLVQRHFPRLGDRLLGAVELTRGEHPDASPALLRAALRQVARETEKYAFEEAVPRRALRRWATVLAVTGVILLAGTLLAPQALRQSLRRWLFPVADIERYTLVSLAELPEEWIVPHGEPFEIACAVEAQSRWRPPTASARIGSQAAVETPVRDGRALFAFPGQIAEAPLVIRIGDATWQLRIIPLHRPELLSIEARVEWPDYLRRPPERRPAEQGRLTLLEGSRVTFEGRVSRTLERATVAPNEPQDAAAEGLHVDADRFVSETRAMGDWMMGFAAGAANRAGLTFRWRDIHAFEAVRPYRLWLSQVSDQPPSIAVDGAYGTHLMLESETLALTIRAGDDHGLAGMGVLWEMATPPARGERTLETAPEPDRLKMQAAFAFSPTVLGIGADTSVVLRGWAEDAFPGRGRVLSAPLRIDILSHERHAEMTRAALESAMTRLDDALRREEGLLDEHRALQSLDDESLEQAHSTTQLDQGTVGERANIAAVESLARDLDSLVRQALRNPEMGAEEISPWMEIAERIRQAASSPMAAAAGALAQASQASDAEPRRTALDEAVRREQEAADALRQAAAEIQETMEFSEARNFVNRLRGIARVQRQIGQALDEQLLANLGGASIEGAQSPVRTALAPALERHDAAEAESTNVYQDLGAFYLRSRREVFNRVRQAMENIEHRNAFGQAREAIERNHLFRAQPTIDGLARRHDDWADWIEEAAKPPKKDGGDGGGGGGGEDQGIEPEVFFGLLRSRVWEEMLREQTRATDAIRGEERYADAVRAAEERQREIADEFQRLQGLTKNGQVAEFLLGLAGVAGEASELLAKPESGAPVIAAQTEIIEAIAALMQGAGGEGSPEPSGAESESMGESMSEGVGSGAGSGTGGGAGGGGADGVEGGPGTGRLVGRDVSRASGDPASWPAAYRDAIQRYYEAMEGTP